MTLPSVLGIADSGIRRAAVIGAGAMGAGIAAQFANAGVAVDLLDIAGSDADRDAPAKRGIARQLKVGGFMHEAAAVHVRPGNIDDHIDRLAEADWIIEAIVEKLAVKRDLFARIEAVRKPGAIVSSNTSTIPRADLVAGMPDDFAASFFITHFFNPPRLMPLAELVSTPQNDATLTAKVARACQTVLGKTVIDCHDTPGFIANRIGCYWIASGIIQAKSMGLAPELADAAMAAMGIPKTGVFGLADLVGLDLVPTVWGSLMAILPASDAIHSYDLPADPTVRMLIDSGRFGRKAKAGFFRMTEQKQLEVVDFATGEYAPAIAVDPKSFPGGGRNLLALVGGDDTISLYARRVLCDVIAYAADNGPTIASDIGAIDAAMELGYAWRQGPFKLADQIGVAQVIAWLEAFSIPVPALLRTALAAGAFYATSGEPLATGGDRLADHATAAPLSIAAFRKAGTPIFANDAASLWDMGDGVACFEIHTKLNSFAPSVFDILEATLDAEGKAYRALLLGNDDPRAFSAGADLSAILAYVAEGRLSDLDSHIARGQRLFRRMRFSSAPVVAAMHGLALGGGCEFGLHANRIVAHAELNVGLPEILVGLVPGWGGCTQLLVNAQTAPDGPRGPVSVARTVFQTIASGRRSSSALDAAQSGILRPGDAIVMNRSELLAAAKAEALSMLAVGFTPPPEAQLVLPGPSGKAAIMNAVHGERAAGRMSDTDVLLADALAGVLTGGPDADLSRPVSEETLLRLEREALIRLAGQTTTAERIAAMLQTGKPLRN